MENLHSEFIELSQGNGSSGTDIEVSRLFEKINSKGEITMVVMRECLQLKVKTPNTRQGQTTSGASRTTIEVKDHHFITHHTTFLDPVKLIVLKDDHTEEGR